MNIEDQIKLISRGTVDIIGKEDLARKLGRGQLITVKFGVDPTAPDIHLGHTVPLQKLRQFQSLGHVVQLVVGDYTALIGDPSGRSETRPMLTPEEISRNMATYTSQVFHVLDKSKTEIHYNSTWLRALGSDGILQLASKYTVQQMLQRRDFGQRVREHRPLAISELLYPLLVGYDSVRLRSDVEIGGTDQLFNFMASREVQQAFGIEAEVVITLPLLEGLDGDKKMSKSLGNAIGITDDPFDMYGKLMSISDTLMLRYYELLSDISTADFEEMTRRIGAGENPLTFKQKLAREIVSRYHGADAADFAERKFIDTYRLKIVSADERALTYATEGDLALHKIVARVFEVSLSEARRLIEQGGVTINGNKAKDPWEKINPSNRNVVSVGRRGAVDLKLTK